MLKLQFCAASHRRHIMYGTKSRSFLKDEVCPNLICTLFSRSWIWGIQIYEKRSSWGNICPNCTLISLINLKQTFPPIIWIFAEGEDDAINSRLPFKIFSTLPGDGKPKARWTLAFLWVYTKRFYLTLKKQAWHTLYDALLYDILSSAHWCCCQPTLLQLYSTKRLLKDKNLPLPCVRIEP